MTPIIQSNPPKYKGRNENSTTDDDDNKVTTTRQQKKQLRLSSSFKQNTIENLECQAYTKEHLEASRLRQEKTHAYSFNDSLLKDAAVTSGESHAKTTITEKLATINSNKVLKLQLYFDSRHIPTKSTDNFVAITSPATDSL